MRTFCSKMISKSSKNKPQVILESALNNVKPLVEVKSRRVGGSTYQVPIEIRAYRGTNISLRWITNFARTRSGKSMAVKLSNEIIDFVLNKSKRFVPHFHIPLQSGSDYLLKKMRQCRWWWQSRRFRQPETSRTSYIANKPQK